jgi:hypothetical protein
MQSTNGLHHKRNKINAGKKAGGDFYAPIRRLSGPVRHGVILLGAAVVSLAATASFAAPRYDGVWSVSIVTNKGDCLASYRYPLRIANGILVNGGDIMIDVSGKVAPSGAVKVTVSHGDTSAIGSGRLSGSSGHGSWRGASCSGSWTAERRGS